MAAGMGGESQTALVLSGGGARGAYQAGVLRGLVEQGLVSGGESRFPILVGASAGALNAAVMAAYANAFGEGVEYLSRMWGTIQPQQVFRTDLPALSRTGLRWIRDLGFGGALRRTSPKSLLDTAPLREFLREGVPFERIAANLESGALRALALPATNLYTADGVMFVQACADVPLWEKGRWSIERTEIGVDHLMASSAIPIFFPPAEIDGRYFGDGAIRNTTPLSPAIRLGADRIVAVGVRQPGREAEAPGAHHSGPPSVAQVAGALLDAVMLDAIEVDVEHSERVNTSVLAAPRWRNRDNPFRLVEVLWLSPTRTFADIAAEYRHGIPAIVRYLMRGLGDDDSTTELASYLLFDAAFCSRLMELGAADVAARVDEIRAFLDPA